MMITKLLNLMKIVFAQDFTGFLECISIRDIEIDISQFTIFSLRISGSQADSFQKNIRNLCVVQNLGYFMSKLL